MTDASFSECGNYRWWLKRRISKEDNILFFIGLNPSKANDFEDDPTMRRLSGFCKTWGYGQLVVVNLFARISHSPAMLRRCSDPIGKANNQGLLFFSRSWSERPCWDLWLGWGAGGVLQGRNFEVIAMMQNHIQNRRNNFPESLGPLCLGLTVNGHPRHPLYLSAKEVLRPFQITSGCLKNIR